MGMDGDGRGMRGALGVSDTWWALRHCASSAATVC